MSEVKPTESRELANATIGLDGFAPQNVSELHQVASLAMKGGYAPKGITLEGAMLAIVKGREIGLPALYSLQNIAVINNRPNLWGDAMLAVVLRSGKLSHFKEEMRKLGNGNSEDNWAAVCQVGRKGLPGISEYVFSVKDAKKAGLWGIKEPWKRYPRRMLQMRARSFALRDRFADELGGMIAREEALDCPGTDKISLDEGFEESYAGKVVDLPSEPPQEEPPVVVTEEPLGEITNATEGSWLQNTAESEERDIFDS